MSDDLISRLRCKYPKGPIMENGEPEFGYRDYSGEFNGVMLPSPIMLEAADRITDLERRNGELESRADALISLFADVATVIGKGFPDCIDNDGQPYQSQFLSDTIGAAMATQHPQGESNEQK